MDLTDAQIQEIRLDILRYIDDLPDPCDIKQRMRFLTEKIIEYAKTNKEAIYQIDGFLIYRLPIMIRIFGISNKLQKEITKIQIEIPVKEDEYIIRATYMKDLIEDPNSRAPFVFDIIDTYKIDEEAIDDERASYIRLRAESEFSFASFLNWMSEVVHKEREKKRKKRT